MAGGRRREHHLPINGPGQKAGTDAANTSVNQYSRCKTNSAPTQVKLMQGEFQGIDKVAGRGK